MSKIAQLANVVVWRMIFANSRTRIAVEPTPTREEPSPKIHQNSSFSTKTGVL